MNSCNAQLLCSNFYFYPVLKAQFSLFIVSTIISCWAIYWNSVWCNRFATGFPVGLTFFTDTNLSQIYLECSSYNIFHTTWSTPSQQEKSRKPGAIFL